LGPGDTVVVGDPAFPIHIYAPAMAGANVIRVPLGNDQAFWIASKKRLMVCTRRQIVDFKLPAQSHRDDGGCRLLGRRDAMCRKRNIMIISDFAYGEVNFDGYKSPAFSGRWRKRNRCRIHYHEQKLQHGRLALRFLLRQCRDDQGACDHQRLLRLRHVRPIQIASVIAMREYADFPLSRARSTSIAAMSLPRFG